MKKISVLLMVGLIAAFASGVYAGDGCKSVKGRITSQLVANFSNGDPCPSPLLLCTEGRFTGKLRGRFKFVANSLSPFQAQDPAAPADVAATTGVLNLKTRFCDGNLVFKDTSAFVTDPTSDGYFASLGTVDGDASSGGCANASGRIRIQGVFIGGCVDCKYVGQICGLGKDDDDDDGDD